MPDGKGGTIPLHHALRNEGPGFLVEISVPDALAGVLAAAGKQLPSPVSGMALIDTGATSTCIDEDIPAVLGLAPLDRREVLTPSGKDSQLRYAVRIAFPGTSVSALPFWVVYGSKLAKIGQTTAGEPLKVLLGRDFS